MLVQTQKQFDQLVVDLTAATSQGAPLAFDTEFLSEKRYYAKLCLVQVLAPTENGVVEGAVDPFGLDLTALANDDCRPEYHQNRAFGFGGFIDFVAIVRNGAA